MKKVISFIKHHKIMTVLFFITLIAIVTVAIVLNNKTSILIIKVAPQDANITINQQAYQNNSTSNFKPGKYTATIYKEGFEKQSVELTLEENKTSSLNIYLLDDGDENNGFSYYQSNYDDLYFLREYYSTHQEDEKLGSFLQKYDQALAIKDVLPLYYYDTLSGASYYIFYTTGHEQCNRIYCLEIGASNDNDFATALQTIEEHGFNDEDYQIIRSYGEGA